MENIESDAVLFHENSEEFNTSPATRHESNKYLIVEQTTLAYFGFDIRGRCFIDFGCGNGHFLQTVARMGATEVYGLDSSIDAIKKAQLEWKQQTGYDDVEATFGVADCIKTQTSSVLGKECAHFDYAISHCLTGYCETKHGIQNLLNNIFVSLKPGGKVCLAVCVPHMDDSDVSKRRDNAATASTPNPKDNYVWSVEEIKQCMEAVKFVNCKRLNPVYPIELATNRAIVEAVANDQWGAIMIGAEKPNLGVHAAKPAFTID